ncbi:MAG: tetratricopeptide repeat protein [Deltaproteobacteria bacterium]|nr:tetratricopeptide repeat protein [Deltaproteobacteria bacterium]
MKYRSSIIMLGTLMIGQVACSPPVMLPPVQEPLDSVAWQNCAKDAEERSGRSLLDDMKMDGNYLMCKGVVLSNDPSREDEAVEMLTESALLDKKDYRPYWLSAQVLTRAGRYEEALTHFSRAQKRAPQMEVPTVKLAQMVAEKIGDDEALQFVEKARKRGLCEFSCVGMLADLYHGTGKRDEALKLYEDMIKKKPDDPEAYIGLARIANLNEDFREEAKQLDKAIDAKGFDKLDKDRKASLYHSLAFAQYNAGKYDKAKKSLKKAVRKKESADWLLLAGWIELKLDDPAMAQIQFDKAIEMDSKLAAAHAGLGDAAKALGDLNKAEKAYKKAAYLDPTSGLFKLKLSALYIELNDFEKAKIQLDDALKLGATKLPQDLLYQVKNAIRNR